MAFRLTRKSMYWSLFGKQMAYRDRSDSTPSKIKVFSILYDIKDANCEPTSYNGLIRDKCALNRSPCPGNGTPWCNHFANVTEKVETVGEWKARLDVN